jgi:hypothetical protein
MIPPVRKILVLNWRPRKRLLESGLNGLGINIESVAAISCLVCSTTITGTFYPLPTFLEARKEGLPIGLCDFPRLRQSESFITKTKIVSDGGGETLIVKLNCEQLVKEDP